MARAQVNIELLEGEIGAWLSTKPHIIEPEADFDTFPGGVVILHKVIRADEVPSHIPAIIGDILFNFRSALDHLANRLVIAPTKDTAFPIFCDRLDRNGKPRSVGVAGGIHPKALAIIERLQPYHRSDPRADLLCILRELNNADKHRLLLVTSLAYTELTTAIRAKGETWVSKPLEPIQLTVGTWVSSTSMSADRYPSFAEEMDMHIEPTTTVTFGETEIAGGQEVLVLIRQIQRYVEAVIGALAAFVK